MARVTAAAREQNLRDHINILNKRIDEQRARHDMTVVEAARLEKTVGELRSQLYAALVEAATLRGYIARANETPGEREAHPMAENAIRRLDGMFSIGADVV